MASFSQAVRLATSASKAGKQQDTDVAWQLYQLSASHVSFSGWRRIPRAAYDGRVILRHTGLEMARRKSKYKLSQVEPWIPLLSDSCFL